MRFFHTADWYLGRVFHNMASSLAPDHLSAYVNKLALDVPVFNYCFSETQKSKALEGAQLSTCTDFTGININASPLVFYG